MAKSQVDILIDAQWKGKREADQAERDIKDIGDAADQSKSGVSGFGSVLSGFAGGALVLLADRALEAVGAMREFAGESVEIAANARETASLLEFSLGPAYQGFTADIEALSDATGRSALKLQESVSPILAMTKAMGFAEEEAADLSVSLSSAALDLGSFFNQDSTKVFEDIQSALAGSSETMQKYGIDVREATLQQRALELGLISSKDEYDRQIRTLVLLEEIQRQASDAMGDAARTADSAANKSKALGDAYFDLKAQIGEELLPLQEKWVDAQLTFVEEAGPGIVRAISNITKGFEEAAPAIRLVSDLLGGLFEDEQGQRIDMGQEQADAWQIGEFGDAIQRREALFDTSANAARSNIEVTKELEEVEESLTETVDDGTTALRRQRVVREDALTNWDSLLKREIRFSDQLGQSADDLARASAFFAKANQDVNKTLENTVELSAEAREEIERLGKAFATALDTVSERDKEGNLLLTDDDLQDLQDGTAAGESLAQAMLRVGKEAGLSAGELALLAVATGDYTREQINAALKAALFEEKLREVIQSVKDKDLTLEEAELELIRFQDELRNTESPLDTMTGQVRDVNTEMEKFEGDRSATMTVQINGLNELREAAELAGRLLRGGFSQYDASGLAREIVDRQLNSAGRTGASQPSTRSQSTQSAARGTAR